MTLTKRQKEVLDFLVSFANKKGYSPSFEEIAKALRLTSLATVHKHINTLERKGFIRRGYNQSRSIEVTQLPKSVREQVIERIRLELPLAGALPPAGHSRRSRNARRFRWPSSRAAATVLCCR
jgi:repressor LexA